jgi:hypothetical protein
LTVASLGKVEPLGEAAAGLAGLAASALPAAAGAAPLLWARTNDARTKIAEMNHREPVPSASRVVFGAGIQI